MLLAPTATGNRTAVDAGSAHCSADPGAAHPPRLAGGPAPARARRVAGRGARAEPCLAMSVPAHLVLYGESPPRWDQLPPSAARGDQPLRASVTGTAGRPSVPVVEVGPSMRRPPRSGLQRLAGHLLEHRRGLVLADVRLVHQAVDGLGRVGRLVLERRAQSPAGHGPGHHEGGAAAQRRRRHSTPSRRDGVQPPEPALRFRLGTQQLRENAPDGLRLDVAFQRPCRSASCASRTRPRCVRSGRCGRVARSRPCAPRAGPVRVRPVRLVLRSPRPLTVPPGRRPARRCRDCSSCRPGVPVRPPSVAFDQVQVCFEEPRSRDRPRHGALPLARRRFAVR